MPCPFDIMDAGAKLNGHFTFQPRAPSAPTPRAPLKELQLVSQSATPYWHDVVAEFAVAFVTSIQTGYCELFHTQMVCLVMVYSGISISLATHIQKQVATSMPMKNSRVKILFTGALHRKKLYALGLTIISYAIV